MISNVLYALERGIAYARQHVQLWFILGLIVVLPLLLWSVSQQFLDVGRANQDTLLKQRLGLLHDSFASVLRASSFDSSVAQQEIETLAGQNPDILQFRVVTLVDNTFIPIAALQTDTIGQPETSADLFKNALVRTDESIIFPITVNGERHWLSFRAVLDGAVPYVIFTETSLEIDRVFFNRELRAYGFLLLVYLFLIGVAYWMYRLTNYEVLYADAQKAIETKDLFMNMLAHELRAPVTAIKGYASLITEDEKASSSHEAASRVQQSSERLLSLINDLLDVARLQSGKISVAAESVDLNGVIDRVISELSISAAEKSVTLSSDITDIRIMGDAGRLQQALTNLVSNAIKYTEQGSIMMTATSHHRTVELRIKDTGMGISHKDQQQLFAPFFRVQSTAVSQITGTGLGMWITKQLIELMGGTIGVESIKGTGTHIVITLPIDSPNG